MMPSFEDEFRTMHTEIQNVSSSKKLQAKSALQVMLDLINPSFSISPVELLR